MTHRYDDGNRILCGSDADEDLMTIYAQAYCCPSDDEPSNCAWPFDSLPHTPENYCYPSACDSTKVQYTTALEPVRPYFGSGLSPGDDCLKYAPPAVGPRYLWEDYYQDAEDGVEWAYVDNYSDNNKQSSPGDDDGDNPYRFVMLDGPAGSIDSPFGSTCEFVRRSEEETHTTNFNVKRSLFTTNKLRPWSRKPTFCFPRARRNEHTAPLRALTLYNQRTAHTASLVNMRPSARTHDNRNPVYKIKIEYNFQAIKRDSGNINMRQANPRLQYKFDLKFYGITPLYEASTAEVDVIAVPGLGSPAIGSWKSPSSNRVWLRDFLPDDVPNIRVLLYGYDTSLLDNDGKESIEDLGCCFLESVKAFHSDTTNRRPLIFIGHSLGGLLIKEALLQPDGTLAKNGPKMFMVTEKSVTSLGLTATYKEDNIPLNTDHSGLVKFESRSQEEYSIVKERLKILVTEAKQEVSKQFEKKFTNEDQQYLQNLLLSHPDSDQRYIEETKGGLLDNSF
ncbi:hypothetical protein BDW71DRAFT_204766 [Aspergillus fruticulosus]